MGFQKPTFLGPDFGGGENTVGYFIPSVDEPLPPALRHAPRFPAGRGGGGLRSGSAPPPPVGPGAVLAGDHAPQHAGQPAPRRLEGPRGRGMGRQTQYVIYT